MSVIPEQNEIDDIPTFAKRIKAKYPEYAEVDDADLTARIVRKHPVYADKVQLPSDFSLRGAATTGYQKLDDVYEQAGRENNVPIDLLIEQGRQETINFKPDVMYGRLDSPMAAKGAGQFMKGTAPKYGLTVNDTQDDRTDPIKSIHAQAKYMRKLLDQFDGDESLALAGYNSGEYRKALAEGRVPNIPETQTYVKTIGEKLAKVRQSHPALAAMLQKAAEVRPLQTSTTGKPMQLPGQPLAPDPQGVDPTQLFNGAAKPDVTKNLGTPPQDVPGYAEQIIAPDALADDEYPYQVPDNLPVQTAKRPVVAKKGQVRPTPTRPVNTGVLAKKEAKKTVLGPSSESQLSVPKKAGKADPTEAKPTDVDFEAANQYLQDKGEAVLTRAQFDAAQPGGSVDVSVDPSDFKIGKDKLTDFQTATPVKGGVGYVPPKEAGKQSDDLKGVAYVFKPDESLSTEDAARAAFENAAKANGVLANFDQYKKSREGKSLFPQGYQKGDSIQVNYQALKDGGAEIDTRMEQVQNRLSSGLTVSTPKELKEPEKVTSRLRGITPEQETQETLDADPLYQQARRNIQEYNNPGTEQSDIAQLQTQTDPKEVMAEYQRLQSNEGLLDKEAIESGKRKGNTLGNAAGGGYTSAGSHGMNLVTGAAQLLNRLRGGSGDDNVTRYLRRVGLEMGAAGAQEEENHPGILNGALRLATKLPMEVIQAGLMIPSGGGTIPLMVGFGSEAILSSGGAGASTEEQLKSGASAAAGGAILGGGKLVNKFIGKGTAGLLAELGVVGGGTYVQSTAMGSKTPGEDSLKMLAIDGIMRLFHANKSGAAKIDITGKEGGKVPAFSDAELPNIIFQASDNSGQKLFLKITPEGGVKIVPRPDRPADVFIAERPTKEQIETSIKDQIQKKFGTGRAMSDTEPSRQFVPEVDTTVQGDAEVKTEVQRAEDRRKQTQENYEGDERRNNDRRKQAEVLSNTNETTVRNLAGDKSLDPDSVEFKDASAKLTGKRELSEMSPEELLRVNDAIVAGEMGKSGQVVDQPDVPAKVGENVPGVKQSSVGVKAQTDLPITGETQKPYADLPKDADTSKLPDTTIRSDHLFELDSVDKQDSLDTYKYKTGAKPTKSVVEDTIYRPSDTEQKRPIKENRDTSVMDEKGNPIDGWTKLQDVPELANGVKGDDATMYRGMSKAEYEASVKNGTIQSNGSMNLGDQVDRKVTSFAVEPSSAKSYATHYAPWHAQPTFESPTYIVRVKRPSEVKFEDNSENYIEHTSGLPMSDVLETWEIRLAKQKPGDEEIRVDNYSKKATTGSGSAPSSEYVARKLEPKGESAVKVEESSNLLPPTKADADVERPQGKPSKIGLSIEAKAIEKGLVDTFGGTAEYDPITIKEQAKLAADIIADSNRVKRIIAGEEKLPSELRGASFIKAVEDAAMAKGDVETLRDLANSKLTSETSLHAQELRMMAERNPDSAVVKLRELAKAREDAAQKRIGKQTIKEAVTKEVDKIKGEVKKTVPKKQDWQSFISSITCR